ncbi:hypothetical protein, partial [Enterococcus faecalis]|uniref:hypothetical protein n=1 Tax=Enterococcus faecalis TaxID=1351 RepID=UPI00254E0F5E
RQHKIIRQHDGHGIFVVVKRLLRTPHSMTQAEGLILLNRNSLNQLASTSNLFSLLFLAARDHEILQLGKVTEVAHDL